MTTTPDSRIRADFGMDGSIATDQMSTASIKLRPLHGQFEQTPLGLMPDMSDVPVKTASEAILQRGYECDPTFPLTHDARVALETRLLTMAEPAPTNTSTAATPDTSTTAGKIAVMQAFARGERVEINRRDHSGSWDELRTLDGEPDWRWSELDYRIAPPPAPRTALQAARKHRSAWKGAHNPDSLHLELLLREIDRAHTITAYPSDLGTTEFKFSAGAVPPGRYRLVRDDA